MAADKQTRKKTPLPGGKSLAKPSDGKAAKASAVSALPQKDTPRRATSAKTVKSAAASAIPQSVARKSAPAKPGQHSPVRDVLASLEEPGGAELRVQGARANFWESPSLADLARQQGVRPVKEASALLGGWPGELNDGFEEAITKARRTGMTGGSK